MAYREKGYPQNQRNARRRGKTYFAVEQTCAHCGEWFVSRRLNEDLECEECAETLDQLFEAQVPLMPYPELRTGSALLFLSRVRERFAADAPESLVLGAVQMGVLMQHSDNTVKAKVNERLGHVTRQTVVAA